MKVYMKRIRMISYTDENGVVTPIRFQIKNEEKEYITIKVNHISEQREEKVAGNRMQIFKCQSILLGVERLFELRHEISTCKWFLYKM